MITNANAADPTRTLTLRRQWVQDSDKRLRQLMRNIRAFVGAGDAFGLGEVSRPNLNVRDFQFDSNANKVKRFDSWLAEQHKKGLLEITTGTTSGAEPWANKYIRSSYQKGLSTAKTDMRKKLGTDIVPVEEGIETAFYTARHADAISLSYTRNFKALQGVTAHMDSLMSDVLGTGLAEGVGPYEMARRLNDVVMHTTNKPFPLSHPGGVRGIQRARLIARTETVRSFNQAQLNEYEQIGKIINEPVYVQWFTALDERVRGSHAVRHNNVYTKEIATTMIGEFNCRCALLSYVKSVDGPVDVRTKLTKAEMGPIKQAA